MPMQIAISADTSRSLMSAEEFLDWLEPGTQAHSFFRREGELMVEFAHGEEIIRSKVVEGFWMRRSWLNPGNLPKATDCLEEVLRGQP
jgi:hypothetical protein